MIKTIDELMFINDGHIPYSYLFIGRGGLGFEPTEYNIKGSGYLDDIHNEILKLEKIRNKTKKQKERLSELFRIKYGTLKRMKGGTVIERDEYGNIINIRTFNEDEKKNIIQNNTIDDDFEEIDKQKKLFIDNPTEDILEFLKEKKISLEDYKNMGFTDYNFLTDIGSSSIKMNNEFIDNTKKIYEDDLKNFVSNKKEIDEKKKEIESEIKSNDNKVLTDTDIKKIQFYETQIKKELESQSVNMDALNLDLITQKDYDDSKIKSNKNIKDYENQIKLIKGEIKEIYKKPSLIDIKNLAPEKVEPFENIKKFHFNKNTRENFNEFINNLKQETIDMPKETYGITIDEFNKYVKPEGGYKAFENAVVTKQDIQRELYKSMGLNKSSNNPNFNFLDTVIGITNSQMPIDLVDITNRYFNELKKYEKKDYDELLKDLYNNQLNSFKRYILDEINKNLSTKNLEGYNKAYNIASKYINDKNEFDENKFKEEYYKRYGIVGIPISVKKFGLLGNYDDKNEEIKKNADYVKNHLNSKWDIKIDYDPNSSTYGKIIGLKTNMKGDYNKNIDKIIFNKKKDNIIPYDYIFTIGTKDKLLTFNYSKFVRDKKITSPLQAFGVGDDFYDVSKPEVSYFIPLEYFNTVNTTNIIKPNINDEKIKDYILEYSISGDKNIPSMLKERFEDLEDYNEYQNILELRKIQEGITKKILRKLIEKDIDIDIDNIKNPNSNGGIFKKTTEIKKKFGASKKVAKEKDEFIDYYESKIGKYKKAEEGLKENILKLKKKMNL